ncbi:MAG: hemolysin family protein, partial [Deltaproteobacteria bacterium]
PEREPVYGFHRLVGQLLFGASVLLGAVAFGPGRLDFFAAAAAFALGLTLVELVLRGFAGHHPEGFALVLAPLLWLSIRLFRPFQLALATLLERLLRPLGGGRPTLAPALHSLEDVEAFLSAESSAGRLGRTDPELLRSVLEFSEKTAREVMVPRTNVVGIELAAPPEEIVRLLAERGHSRLPVYRETIDDIVGILHTRDLVSLLQNPKLIVVQDLMRPAYFVPWAKRIGALLRELQGRRIHMAVVVDEYGGVMGVVTLEDILEELVGEIRDELGPEGGKDIEPHADGSALVRAAISVDDFAEAFGVTLPLGEYETLGGWLNSQSGTIPEQGDRFFAEGLQVIVVDRTPRRVRRVKVVRTKGRGLAAPPPATPAGRSGAAVAPAAPASPRRS